jgi:anti-sigma regulatory factor (Ser/Thr protein kinase)
MPGSSSELRLELRCDSEAPAAVREAIRALDVGWLAGDAMLVASELVTNAVIHSGCTPSDRLEVGIQVDRDHLLISVRDPGSSGRAARLREDDDAFGGMGLRVVEQLARHWSSERGDGHRVWAELARV